MKIKTTLFLVLFCLSLFISGLMSYIFYKQSAASKWEELRDNACDIAYAVALSVNGEKHMMLLSKDDMYSDDYAAIKANLHLYLEMYPKVKNIYTYARTEVPTQWKYIIDAKNAQDENGDGKINANEEVIPVGTPYDISMEPELNNAFDKPVAEKGLKSDEWGTYISAYAPIFNHRKQTVAVVRLDVSVDPSSGAIAEGFFNMGKRILPILLGSAVFSLIVSIFISYMVASPINRIIDTTKLISQGKFGFLTTKKRKDEMGALIQSVNEMSKNIKMTIEKLTTLNKTAETLAMNIDYEESIKVAMNISLEIVRASKGIIFLYNKAENIFSIGAISGMATAKVVGEEFFVEMDKFSLKPDNSVVDFLSSKPDIYTVIEVESIPQLSQVKGWLKKTGMTLIAPFMIKREMRGIIMLDAEANDKEFLKTLINQISMSLENARLYRDAIIDGLTGLYVYRYFEIQLSSEIRRAERFGKKLSVILIDFDNFKKFNDEHGHLAGNFILKETAKMIKLLARSVDVISRYGGEEIAVLLPETDAKGAAVIAEKIRSKVEEFEYVHQFKKFRVTVSAGIAEWNIDNPVDAQTLVSWADEAISTAKKEGKNRVAQFEV